MKGAEGGLSIQLSCKFEKQTNVGGDAKDKNPKTTLFLAVEAGISLIDVWKHATISSHNH